MKTFQYPHARREGVDRSKTGRPSPNLTGIVRATDEFCQRKAHRACQNRTEVHLFTENKAFFPRRIETKVTSGFGEANANIRHDCVNH